MPVRFVVLYKPLVHSHLQHAVSVWNPHQLWIDKLEKVQKKATKLVIAVRTFSYEHWLKYLDWPTLNWWIGGDMIEVNKIFTGKYDTTVTSWFTSKHVEHKYV